MIIFKKQKEWKECFAIFQRYCEDINEWVWLENIFKRHDPVFYNKLWQYKKEIK